MRADRMRPRPRDEAEQFRDDEADEYEEFVALVLWALDSPEVQTKIRSIIRPTPVASSPPVPGRGQRHRRGI